MNQVASSVQYTVENAPRDPKELGLIGRFRLKDLAMKAGLGDTTENRAAITNMKIEDLAASVAARLAALDAATPARPAVVPPPSPEEATAPQQEAPKRSPRTPKAPQNTAASTAQDQSILEPLNDLREQMEALKNQMIQHENATALALNKLGEELSFQAHLNTALSLFFAEEQLGGSRPDILASALSDLPGIVEMVGKAMKGGK